MNSIQLISWVDVWALQAAVWRQQKQLEGDGPVKELFFRMPPEQTWLDDSDDESSQDTVLLGMKEWTPVKRLLARVRTALTTPSGPPEFGAVFLEALQPQGHVDWHRNDGSYTAAHHRFHIAIVTNPAAQIYAGLQCAHLPCGQIALIDQSLKCSAVNYGVKPRIHLVVDVRRPEET